MRRFLKPVLVTVGAVAATFMVVNSATFNAAPAAKAKTFCQVERNNASIVSTTLVPIELPTLPTIPPISTPTIPCITLPTVSTPTSVPFPNISVPEFPTPSIPTLPDVTLPTIEIPVIVFPTTTSTTTYSCTAGAQGYVSVAC